MPFDQDKPYNDLPLLLSKAELEMKTVPSRFMTSRLSVPSMMNYAKIADL